MRPLDGAPAASPFGQRCRDSFLVQCRVPPALHRNGGSPAVAAASGAHIDDLGQPILPILRQPTRCGGGPPRRLEEGPRRRHLDSGLTLFPLPRGTVTLTEPVL